MARPTAEDIKAYRDATGVGLLDARRILAGRWREERLHALRTSLGMNDLQPKDLIELIDILLEQ